MKLMTFTKTQIAAVVAAAVLSMTGSAVAQQPAASSDLTVAQVIQKLESQGYTRIEDVEKDDGVWEVEATAPNGTRVELELDLKDARILKEQPDDDND